MTTRRKLKRPAEVGTLTVGAISSILLAAGFSKPVAAIAAIAVAVLPGIITAIVASRDKVHDAEHLSDRPPDGQPLA